MPDTVFTTPQGDARLARLWADLLADPVPPDPAAAQRRTAAGRFEMNDGRSLRLASDREGPSRLRVPDTAPAMHAMASSVAVRDEPVRSWRVDLVTWFHRLVELEDAVSPSADEADLSIPSPFRWEPKPGWISAGSPLSKATDARRYPRGPKIPIRPLHKQPFYSRFFFYLRRWLSRSVWQESDPAA